MLTGFLKNCFIQNVQTASPTRLVFKEAPNKDQGSTTPREVTDRKRKDAALLNEGVNKQTKDQLTALEGEIKADQVKKAIKFFKSLDGQTVVTTAGNVSLKFNDQNNEIEIKSNILNGYLSINSNDASRVDSVMKLNDWDTVRFVSQGQINFNTYDSNNFISQLTPQMEKAAQVQKQIDATIDEIKNRFKVEIVEGRAGTDEYRNIFITLPSKRKIDISDTISFYLNEDGELFFQTEGGDGKDPNYSRNKEGLFRNVNSQINYEKLKDQTSSWQSGIDALTADLDRDYEKKFSIKIANYNEATNAVTLEIWSREKKLFDVEMTGDFKGESIRITDTEGGKLKELDIKNNDITTSISDFILRSVKPTLDKNYKKVN